MQNNTLEKLRDPKFYLENFTKIKGKKPGQLIPFILNEAQKDFYNSLRKHNRLITLKARQLGFCLSPDTKILTADLRWVELDDIKKGEEIIAVDEKVLGGPGSSRKMRTAIVENKWDVYEPAFRLKLDNGQELVATAPHRFLCKARGAVHTQWRTVKDIYIGDDIRFISLPWEKSATHDDGWFSGILDGEGSFRYKNHTGAEICACQRTDGEVWQRIKKYLIDRNYTFKEEIDFRKAGEGSKLGDAPVGKAVINRMDELFHIIGVARPSRFIGIHWWEGKKLPCNHGWARVMSIEILGTQRMIDLQTSTKTFIANGFVSHNSTAITGFFYHNTITTPGTTTALIGYNSDLTAELLDKVKTFYKTTPAELRPTIHYNSKYEISFPEIDSKILVLPSTANVGRGYTLSNCLVTELSSWENAEEKMMTLEASVPIDGRLVVESCVTKDTIVLTKDGPRFIENIHNWNDNKIGFSKGKKILIDGHYGLKPTNTYYNSGIQKGFRVITKHGYEIGMSSIHKLFVLKKDKLEFVKSKDLKIGDKLVIKYGQELWGDKNGIDWDPTKYLGYNKKNIKLFNPKIITEELAYLIGVILGDGYISKKYNKVVVTNIDKDLINFLLNNKLGLHFYQSKGENYYHFTCTNQSFIEFLQEYIGFKEGITAPYKEIPKCILGWSRNNVIAFLQGLFDTDGSCRKDRGEVSFVSTSKKIVDTMRSLLLNFGIISRTYSYNAKPSKIVKVWSNGYRLEISRSHSNIFLDKIGFRIKRKQDNRNIQKKCYSCLQEFIPGLGKILKKNMRELGLKYSDIFSGMNKCFFSKSGNITYLTLGRILDKCRNKNSKEYLDIKELYDKKYFYDEIKEIIPIEENVYDFTVDDGHTVVYNGIVGHQTPRGQGNLFHRMWMDDQSDYIKKEYGWWWGYSKEEIEIVKRRMNNPQKFAQEYGLAFLSSGRAVFSEDILVGQRKNVLKVGDKIIDKKTNEEFIVHEEDGWRIYKLPQNGHFYCSAADTSEGVEGGDYSVATIWDRESGEEVAMYRGLIPPDAFGRKLDKMGRKYNDALMAVEVNNHGLTTLTILKQLVYPSIYFRPAKFDEMGSRYTDKMGWRTTKLTRDILLDDFAQACRDRVLIIHSKEIVDEMSVFVYDSRGDASAQSGFHDDCVFSAAIAFQAFKSMWHSKLDQLDYTKYLPKSFAY